MRVMIAAKHNQYASYLQGMINRCDWATTDPLYIRYHDEEWGVPKHDDRELFELLILEGAQAGLSWITILKKRENYRKAFDNFEPKKVAKYDGKKVRELLSDKGIVRNRLKIMAAIQNARSLIEVQGEFGSFDEYVWKFVGMKQMRNSWKSLKELPSKTRESDAMSKEFLLKGFRFVGSTICYSFMQAAGIVNDHVVGCFRYDQVANE